MSMKWAAGTVALLTAFGAGAQEAGTTAMLEQIQQQLTELKAANERLQAEVDYLKSNALGARKEAAENDIQIEKIPALESAAKAADWASRITWKGDLRYRHERIDAEEATAVRNRQRLRARFGLTAKVNDTVSAVVQLATDGGISDPRSTNQDLGNAWTRKPLAIDLAYAEWKPNAQWTLQFGKTPMPWLRTGSFFFDGDITPEGTTIKFTRGALFGSAFGYWASERSAAADSALIGGQLGARKTVGGVVWTGAVGYFDMTHVQGEITTTATGCTANPVFFGGPQGNSTYVSGGCARLLNDFNDLQLQAQADFKVGKLPVNVFVDYMQNTKADNLDTAWAAGFVLGKASDPGTWEAGYVFQKAEKDSVFGQFHDSDFGGNLTDSQGGSLKFGWAPARNWTLNGTYHMNKRFVNVGTERDYTRLMLDMSFKF